MLRNITFIFMFLIKMGGTVIDINFGIILHSFCSKILSYIRLIYIFNLEMSLLIFHLYLGYDLWTSTVVLLQLLEPGRYIWLLKALYGLLMLLPQVWLVSVLKKKNKKKTDSFSPVEGSLVKKNISFFTSVIMMCAINNFTLAIFFTYTW